MADAYETAPSAKPRRFSNRRTSSGRDGPRFGIDGPLEPHNQAPAVGPKPGAPRSNDTAVAAEIVAPLVVAPARYVLLPLANAITGYSIKAMERKIERGDWTEGKLWKRAPDGHILIDMMGYQRWVESR